MSKHQLVVGLDRTFPPATHVFFQCKNCVAAVSVPRDLMFELLTTNPMRLATENFDVWKSCPKY